MAKYAYSYNEENYQGDCDSREAAAAEAFAEDPEATVIWVGEVVPPPQPEGYWDAEDWIEHVAIQDEYATHWGEDWDGSTKEQRQELETEVRAVLAAWLDRHDMRPTFFNIDNPKKVEREQCP